MTPTVLLLSPLVSLLSLSIAVVVVAVGGGGSGGCLFIVGIQNPND